MTKKRKRRQTRMLRNPQLESLEMRAMMTCVPGEFCVGAEMTEITDSCDTGDIQFLATILLTANTLKISEGETVELTTDNLDAINTMDPEAELLFLIDDIVAGSFENADDPGEQAEEFSLEDVELGLITFTHDGSTTAPAYTVEVEDVDSGFITEPEDANIIFHSGFNAPTGDFDGDGDFDGVDIDALTSNIAVGPADPARFDLNDDGQVNIADRNQWLAIAGANNLSSGNPYPIGDANLDGAVDVSDFNLWNTNKFSNQPAWTKGDFNADGAVDISDFNQWNSNKFQTSIDDVEPALTANALTIAQGESVIISSSNLAANDPDGPNSALTFSISQMSSGRFERVNNPGTAVTSFTQADVASNAIQFVHDGSSNAPGYLVSVSDGVNTTSPAAANVTFTPSTDVAPSLTANRLTIGQGDTVTLNSSNLAANDPDGPNDSLTFTISKLAAGRFERTNDPGNAVTGFTQSDVNSGQIRFVHDGTSTAPAYFVSVSDGSNTTTPAAASINFVPTSSENAPSIVANTLSITRGNTVVLGSSHLEATDPDTASSTLTYTVGGVANGQFERVSAPGTAITTFSQSDIDSRQIQFVHDGTMNAPAYSVTASDGTNSSSTLSATINFSMGHMHEPGATFQAALDLVTDAQSTHRAVASGDWSDSSVWENGQLPTAGARIVIPADVSVTVDSEINTRFETLRIDGTLRFATNANTRLRVDTMVSTHDGVLEIGTNSIPIQPEFTAKVEFIDDGTINRNIDPTQIGRGAILHGTTTIYGAETTGRMALATHPMAGSSQLQLSTVPVGWEAGDQLIITSTNGPENDEIRTISSISGTTVTLNQPLAMDHIAPQTDLDVYVANTTRNVQFSSENSSVANRGHIMFMHTLNVDTNYASFANMGRTDKTRELDDFEFIFTEDAVGNLGGAPIDFQLEAGPATNIRGRYPIHFHRGGTEPGSTPARMNGSVVLDSPGWGFVNHSSNVDITNNVTYDVKGAAFYTEAGNEIGSIVGNLAIRTVNPNVSMNDDGTFDVDLQHGQQSFGVDGDGFWLSGHMVSLRDNVSAGASGHGIIIWSDGLVEPDTGRATVPVERVANGHLITNRSEIPVWWAPLAPIENNTAYSSVIGFRSRYVHSATYLGEVGSSFHETPDQAYVETLAPTVDGLVVWGARDGVLLNYNERMSLKNARLIGTGAPWMQFGGTTDTGMGIDMYNEVSRGPGVLENISVEGYSMGILAPRHDDWTVRNLDLRNTTDLYFAEPRQFGRTFDMDNVTFGSLTGTAVAGTQSQRQNVVMNANLEPDALQPYWFLLPDRISLNGQGLYFNQQAANHVLLENFDPDELITPISTEFFQRTNQSLMDQYSTSFGGAITPTDATTSPMISGGVIGSETPPTNISPPLYNMVGEAYPPILIDPGNLTNFDPPGANPSLPSGQDADDESESEADLIDRLFAIGFE